MPTSKKKNTSFITIVLITLSIVTSALGLYFWKFYSYGLSNKTADWASFGAYVGGVLGTCFAFATFWMLLSTFRLQQKQSKNIEVQQFETTFYSLLELHNQKLSELDLDPDKLKKLFDNDPRIGQALSMSDDEFKKVSDSSVFQSKEEKYGATEKYLEELQREILEDIELSQYFRILYQLLKYIARNNIQNPNHNFDAKHLNNMSNLSIEYEKMYSSIARGFVPVSLLPIIALNCIPTPNGLENLDDYQALLERYNFLEHIRFDLLPKNLATFRVLNNYNYALGNNKETKNIAVDLKKKYKDIKINEDSYLNKISLNTDQKDEDIKAKTFNERCNRHIELISKGFYSDKNTIHEPLIFLLSNTATIIFYLLIAIYLAKNTDLLIMNYSYLTKSLICIAVGTFCAISIYILIISGGRLANSLGEKVQSGIKAFIVILFGLALVVFTTIISSIMPGTYISTEEKTQISLNYQNKTPLAIDSSKLKE